MGEQGKQGPLETLVGLVVLAAVLTQTWILVQEATQGDAGRHLRRWWGLHGRPQVVRVATWINAHEIAEAMCTHEIEPYLREAS